MAREDTTKLFHVMISEAEKKNNLLDTSDHYATSLVWRGHRAGAMVMNSETNMWA